MDHHERTFLQKDRSTSRPRSSSAGTTCASCAPPVLDWAGYPLQWNRWSRSWSQSLAATGEMLVLRLVIAAAHASAAPAAAMIDVVVYGGTPGGVVAAVAARRVLGPNSTVALVESGRHVGGMMAAGMNDDSVKGDTQAYGGLAAEIFRRTALEYGVPAQLNASCFAAEPHVFNRAFRSWLQQEGVVLHTGQAVSALKREGGSIVSVSLDDGTVLAAAQVIDATYEGDLLPLAGVPFMYGRESQGHFNESFAGQGLCLDPIRNPQQLFLMQAPVDPFVSPGSKGGPVLPGVDGVYESWNNASGAATADQRVQSFNFRACLTRETSPSKAVPIPKPAGYDASRYELLVRYIAGLGRGKVPFKLIGGWGRTDECAFSCGPYMDGKCCTNDGAAITIAPMGNETYEWALASPARRVQLRDEFVTYTLGLWHFLATDPRVPAAVVADMKAISLCADEWPDTGNLPPTPYIREGRRLLSHDIFTQEDYRARAGISKHVVPSGSPGIGASRLNFSIGLGFWFIDSHPVRRLALEGLLQNEGCLQSPRGSAGWEIPFGIIAPPNGSVDNLLVVCAPSSSHVGFQPLRVEPTFMTLGHASGVAAALAVQGRTSPKLLSAGDIQAALAQQGAILKRADMLPHALNSRCSAEAPPAPTPHPPPPPLPNGASAVVCGSVPAARVRWDRGGTDGSLRPANNASACLTVLGSPEPVAGHGIAVGLERCRDARSGPAEEGQLAQKWVMVKGNSTVQTAIAPAPHCFGRYSKSTCGLLTVLGWVTTTEKPVMMWSADGALASTHPQWWSYSTAEKTVATTVGPRLCLAHSP